MRGGGGGGSAAAVALAAGLLLVSGCGGGGGPDEGATAAVVDPIGAARTGRWNDALVCPQGACEDADRAAPVYPVGPARLVEAWRAVVAAAPRAALVGEDAGRMLLLVRQRSAVFGFTDTVAVRVVPGPTEGSSSFAAYGRAEVGFYDFGVNRRRLAEWQAAVERELGAAGSTGGG